VGLTWGYQIATAELENHIPAAQGADDLGIDIRDRVAGHFERGPLTFRLAVIPTEFLKVIGYLAATMEQIHLRS
jgi:hypothetical protein